MMNTHNVKARLAMLNHKGFTLVEVLIALLVLGILFVPVSNAFLQSVHLNQHLRRQVTAVREAQTAMEVTLSLMNELDSENQIEEDLVELLAAYDTSELIKADTTVEVAPLHEDSPFMVITATSSDTSTNTSSDTSTDLKDSQYNFTLTTLHLPGEAPWLTPKEYRVVTP